MAWLDPKDAAPESWTGEGRDGQRGGMSVSSDRSYSDLPGTRPPNVPPTNPPTVDVSISDFEIIEPVATEGPVKAVQASYEFDDEEYPAKLTYFPREFVDDSRDTFDDVVSTWAEYDGHHAVASVIDWGFDPQPWIATEAVDGQLTERETPLKTEEALWVITRVASALDHVHGFGIVHGGISPRTVVFEEVWEEAAWDYPKVVNLGLWSVLYEGRDGLVGTNPGYSAPEQVWPERFGPIDASTDIYQLGVIAYELLTGQAPFTGSPRSRLRKTVRKDPRPVDQLNPTVPDELALVITKCLRKEKLARYETVQEVRREIHSVR